MYLKFQKLLFTFIVIICIIIYCEFLIYYIFIAKCTWPTLNNNLKPSTLRIVLIADIHLLGPRKQWFDKMRREWQMHRMFQSILTFNSPEAIFILGDLFDEGEWSNNEQFEAYVERFHNIFAVPRNVKLYIVAGNHDIGYHSRIRYDFAAKFSEMMNAPAVQLITIRDNNFVLLNSMALEADSCRLCVEARRSVNNISDYLECSQHFNNCSGILKKTIYSRPILIQHFPLYRTSDSVCMESNITSFTPSKGQYKFRKKNDVLSYNSTQYLISQLKPRLAFGGHTHRGCYMRHRTSYNEIDEYSIPSFSWRNTADPKYMLLTINIDDYAVKLCDMPTEITIISSYVVLIIIYFLAYYYMPRRSLLRRRYKI